MTAHSMSDVFYYIGFFSLTLSCLMLAVIGIKRSAWWSKKPADEGFDKTEKRILCVSLIFFVGFVAGMILGLATGP